MIMLCYRLMCAWMVGLVLWGLFTQGTRQDKAVMALMFVPLVLRMLLIK
jgi:MFS-type transporter involved in bile tolerance (Atg22 family)